jgi:hypothetical protein
MERDAGHRRRSGLISNLWRVPEIPLALLSLAFYFVWEFLQVPTHEGMAARPHWERIRVYSPSLRASGSSPSPCVFSRCRN